MPTPTPGFHREADFSKPLSQTNRRDFETTEEQAFLKSTGREQIVALPPRPSIRGSLVERDNPAEFMEFHYNPSSYSIKKKSKWQDQSVTGGTDTQNWTGSSPTEVSFELLLNDIEPHADRPIFMTTEQSLSWLHQRLRARSEQEASRKGKGPRGRRVPWLNIRDPKNGKPPPILVLFGVSDPFECVLESADVTTIFQGVSLYEAASSTRNGDPLGQAANVSKAGNHQANPIIRATVRIELKEYVNAPSSGG